jgi:poly(3-hydroxybutyrate) depolymerase
MSVSGRQHKSSASQPISASGVLHMAICALLAIAWGFLADADAQNVERLPALTANVTAISVSGVSSGGYMAVQMHVAHSAIVHGAGVLAAGPYYCAQGSAWAAQNNCMKPDLWAPVPATPLIKTETDTLAQLGAIDELTNLRRARVWLYSGTHDDVVLPVVVEALARFYRLYVSASAITLVHDVPSGHGMVTEDYGGSCAVTAPPYINKCHFDAAGQLLEYIEGPLAPPAAQESGRLIAFDQREFTDGKPSAISLADTGYAYVPRNCASKSCRVHVAFHGCRQSVEAQGLAFVAHAGYNRWADTNNIIVLYPQTIARYGVWGWPPRLVYNPRGCWDWWGYTGADYHTRSAPQIRAVKAMIDRLGGKRR